MMLKDFNTDGLTNWKTFLPKAKSRDEAVLLSALYAWAIPEGGTFQKFLEPCPHQEYKEGTSIKEELKIGRHAFNKHFDRFGIRYLSKTRFLKAANPFEGKRFAMYLDRKQALTFFVANPEFLPQSRFTALQNRRA